MIQLMGVAFKAKQSSDLSHPVEVYAQLKREGLPFAPLTATEESQLARLIETSAVTYLCVFVD